MPLVIGDVHATIEVVPPARQEEGREPTLSARDSEAERVRALSALRLEAERRIDVRGRDPRGGC